MTKETTPPTTPDQGFDRFLRNILAFTGSEEEDFPNESPSSTRDRRPVEDLLSSVRRDVTTTTSRASREVRFEIVGILNQALCVASEIAIGDEDELESSPAAANENGDVDDEAARHGGPGNS